MRIKRRKSDFQGDHRLCLESKKAVAYIRGSTKKQELTIPMQLNEITRYAERKGLELVGDPFIDRGVSANVLTSDKAKFLNRPQAAEIIARMTAEGIYHIVVWSVDRSAREVEDMLATIRVLWEHHGISMHFAMENIVSSDPDAKQKITFFTMFAEMESTRRKERQVGAFAELRDQQGRCGMHEPFGWRVDPNRKRQTKAGTSSDFLVPDPVEQLTLGAMLDLAAAGFNTGAIAKHLNASGMKPKGKPCYAKGGAQTASRGIWYPATVQSVLEHARHADGRTCIVDKQNSRLVFRVVENRPEQSIAA